MKQFIIILFIFIGTIPMYCQSQTLLFTVELNEITHYDWPGLHSFSHAEWDDHWVFIGGRKNGLHGFFALTGFPETKANDQLWVMDHTTGQYWSYSVINFPSEWRDFLRGTNPQFVQQGKYLYVIGGYGLDNSTGDFITHDIIMAIDLSILIPNIQSGISPIDAFRSIKDSRLKICGGELHELNEFLYLIGGHDFNGLYKQNGPPTFTQEYTSAIKKFKIIDNGTTFSISNYSSFTHEEYHRRDLNLSSTITKDEEFALVALGGVFKPDAEDAYLNPIYITEDQIKIDYSYEQKMSQYTCPVIPLYNEELEEQYFILFGGISLHYWDENQQSLAVDPLMPFIDDISTFVKYSDGSSTEFIMSEKFDELLGSNAIFIQSDNVPTYQNGVIKYSQLSGRQLLGYIYGGIEATIPNITPSVASNHLFEVFINAPITSEVENNELPIDPIIIYPNPSKNKINIGIQNDFNLTTISILDFTGNKILDLSGTQHQLLETITAEWTHLPNGIYFIKFYNNTLEITKKMVKG